MARRNFLHRKLDLQPHYPVGWSYLHMAAARGPAGSDLQRTDHNASSSSPGTVLLPHWPWSKPPSLQCGATRTLCSPVLRSLSLRWSKSLRVNGEEALADLAVECSWVLVPEAFVGLIAALCRSNQVCANPVILQPTGKAWRRDLL